MTCVNIRGSAFPNECIYVWGTANPDAQHACERFHALLEGESATISEEDRGQQKKDPLTFMLGEDVSSIKSHDAG